MKRTIFLKQVKEPCEVKSLLKPASQNSKLGKGSSIVRKGAWKGLPMFQLSLEERATCSPKCPQTVVCYGNNMPFAHRMNHLSSDFLPMLGAEVKSLLLKYPTGIVIRLHVLGDFYSAEYVKWWTQILRSYPTVKIYGYTHRKWKAIEELNAAGAWIRYSDAGGEMSANLFESDGDILCPVQTGKTASCTTCALCWSTKKPIRFLLH